MDDVRHPKVAGLKTVGARIQCARLEKGLTTAELARLIGVAEATLKTWERGKACPRSNRMPTIAGTLSVSMRWLMSGHGVPWEEKSMPKMTAIVDEELLNELREVRAGIDRSIGRMTQLETRLVGLLRRDHEYE